VGRGAQVRPRSGRFLGRLRRGISALARWLRASVPGRRQERQRVVVLRGERGPQSARFLDAV